MADRDDTFEELLGGQDDEVKEGEEEERQFFYFGPARVGITERRDHMARDLAYIPAWDDEYEPNVGLFESLITCVGADQPVVLTGPKGSGKSSAVEMLAALVRQPLIRINMTGQTRVRDFVGFKTLDYEEDEESGEVFQVINWIDGSAPVAVRRNYWLLIDEIDAAPPGVLFALQALLEGDRQMVILENAGEVVRPPGEGPGLPDEPDKRRFRIFATANTLGFGDETGFYAGTNVMNQATLDRFGVIAVDYPDPAVEKKIIRSRTGLSGATADKMVAFAKKIREEAGNDRCGVSISTRQLIQWGKMIGVLWPGKPKTFAFPTTRGDKASHITRLAYGITVGNKLPSEDREFFAGVFQRLIGFKVG